MPSASPAQARSRIHVQYLGFTNVEDAREYRYAVHSPDGQCEFRFRIALSAFAGARILIQDGPDVCYQQLVRELATGDSIQHVSRSILDTELLAYRAAHTPAPRHA
jgi:hypothetical protein